MSYQLTAEQKAYWRICREIRFEIMRGICEVCGNPLDPQDVVGHHRHSSRCCGEHSLYNMEVRHRDCEEWCHYVYPDGKIPYRDRDPRVIRIYEEIRKWFKKEESGYLPELSKRKAPTWAIEMAKKEWGYKEIVLRIYTQRGLTWEIRKNGQPFMKPRRESVRREFARSVS